MSAGIGYDDILQNKVAPEHGRSCRKTAKRPRQKKAISFFHMAILAENVYFDGSNVNLTIGS
jgi:hypothetical protein